MRMRTSGLSELSPALLENIGFDSVVPFGKLNEAHGIPRAGTRCSMNVADAEKNFAKLVDKVYAEGISVDLERDDRVIARLIPAEPISPPALSPEEWRVRILETAGKWKGKLERPEPGEYEQREPLS